MRAKSRLNSIERQRGKTKKSFVIGYEHDNGLLYTEAEGSNKLCALIDVDGLPKNTTVLRIVYTSDWGSDDNKKQVVAT